MKIQDKLAKKYGSNTVILPPPLEEEIGDQKITPDKLSPFLSQFVLEEGEDSLDPSLFEEYEPEVTKDRRYDTLAKDVEDDFQAVKKQLSEDSYNPPKADGDMPTVAPPRKRANVSANELVKRCDSFLAKAHMLPPPLNKEQGKDVKAPSMAPPSNVDLPDYENVDTFNWKDIAPLLQPLLTKKKHNAEVAELKQRVDKALYERSREQAEERATLPTEIPPASAPTVLAGKSIDSLVKMCVRFNDLCRKF